MVALLYSLITAAFICMSLAVATYVKMVGFQVVAMLGILLSLPIGIFLLLQCLPSSISAGGQRLGHGFALLNVNGLK